MRWWITALLALFLAGAIFGAGAVLAQRPDQRNWRYFPDMAKSAAYRGHYKLGIDTRNRRLRIATAFDELAGVI